jgi:hypothetical protein
MAFRIASNRQRARAGSEVALPFFLQGCVKNQQPSEQDVCDIRGESCSSRVNWVVQETFIFVLSWISRDHCWICSLFLLTGAGGEFIL